jgi:HD superfamily phosphodiesterase
MSLNCDRGTIYWMFNYYSEKPINTILEYVKKEMAGFDSSHDIQHIQNVQSNANYIFVETFRKYLKVEKTQQIAWQDLHNTEFEQLDLHPTVAYFIVIASSLLHDVADHKYITDINAKLQEVKQFLQQVTTKENTDIIMDIIDNISFSKEKNGTLKDLGKYQILRDIVSDADKLEALGERGILRCYAYQYAKTCNMQSGDVQPQDTTVSPEKLEKWKIMAELFLPEPLKSETLVALQHCLDTETFIVPMSVLKQVNEYGEFVAKSFGVNKKQTIDDLNDPVLLKKVVEHAHEKLLLLKDSYIRTAFGKKMAEDEHAYIEKWVKEGEAKLVHDSTDTSLNKKLQA